MFCTPSPVNGACLSFQIQSSPLVCGWVGVKKMILMARFESTRRFSFSKRSEPSLPLLVLAVPPSSVSCTLLLGNPLKNLLQAMLLLCCCSSCSAVAPRPSTRRPFSRPFLLCCPSKSSVAAQPAAQPPYFSFSALVSF